MPYAISSGRVKASLLGVSALAVLAACSSGSERAEPSAHKSAAIAGGVADLEHTSVFAQFAHRGQNAGGLCTGTLIAPNLVLTARHCVAEHDDTTVICGQSPLDQIIAATDIIVTNEPDIETASRWYQGAAIEVPPQGDDTCGFDVALLILGENVPEAVAVPYVPRIDRMVQVGETYTAVGYGLTSNNASGERQQRSGLAVQCAPGSCGGAVRSREFVGETGICEGDSGGPALDSDGKVVGVVSRGSGSCDSPVYTAVSQWRDWLLEVAAQAALSGGYTPPFWVTTGRSDPPLTGTGGGGSGAGGSGAGGSSSGGAPGGGGMSAGGGAPAGAGSGGQSGGSPVGRPCDASSTCPSGYACYYEQEPADAVCTARCETGCGDGLVCNAKFGVCTAPRSTDDGGCSVEPRAGRAPSGVAWLALGAALWVARRRRPSR